MPAAAEQAGDLLYTVVGGSEVTVTGYAGTGGSLVIPPEIAGLPVTRIGNAAFYQCSNLTSLVIGNSVSHIGVHAFLSCSELTGPLVIPDSVMEIGLAAFQDCSRLTSVSIGNKVAQIGTSAFQKCCGLTGALVLPDSVTYLGGGAFTGCSNLTSLTIGNGLAAIERFSFESCEGLTGTLVIPDNVASVGDGAFNGCKKLTSLVIGNGVTTIGDSAFNGCEKLTSLTLGSGREVIKLMAFATCSQLSEPLIFSNSMRDIGEWAFAECGVTDVTIGNGVTNIGDFAFSGCGGLTNVSLGNRVSNIGRSAFDHCLRLAGGMTIPDSVTDLGIYAFNTCSSLTSVVIGSGVKNVGNSTFAQCHGLTALAIGGGVTNIGLGAFMDCRSLADGLVLPDSVTSIEVQAFRGCNSLTSLMIGRAAAVIGEAAFSACGRLAGIYFKGEAPLASGLIGSTATVFRVAGEGHWGAEFGGRPTALWQSRALFDAGAGEASVGESVFAVGTPYGDLPDATWLGHAFLGWRTGPGGAGTSVMEDTAVPYVVGDHTVYADWEASVYSLRLAAEGGVVNPGVMNVTYGEPYGELPTPQRPGYAFGGWWTGPGGGGALVTAATPVTTFGDHKIYAKWTADATKGPSAMAGVTFGLDLPEEFVGAARVAFKGLPAGLKYNPATLKVAGVPTRAGIYTVTLSAAGVPPLVFTITVEALPPWAQGTFNGTVAGGGLASLSVTAAGKISGKIAAGGTNYTFSAASFAAGGDSTNGFSIAASVKAGKATLPLALTVTKAGTPAALGAAAGTLGGSDVALWSDVWKNEAARLAPLIGYYTATLAGNDEYGSGYLTLTVDKAGKVKVGGKLADGTAVSLAGALILDASNRVFAVVYAAPKTYSGGCLFGLVEFADPGSGGKVFLRLLEGAPFAWSSLNPQAAAVYGAGFDRAPELAGGWYSKSGDLGAYYAGRTLTAGADTNAPAPELTVGAVRYDSLCWNPSGIALTPTGKAGAMAGFAAPAAGKPVDPDKDGVWDYSAGNSVGLKISLARPTGIFKGSFLAWFDYPVKKHVSKSLSFEGALTPVRENAVDGVEGRGFFLWADKIVPPAPAKPYAFKWSYDFLLSGN